MHVLWLTDLHLDFLSIQERFHFYEGVKSQFPDCIFITGDIANGTVLKDILIEMAEALPSIIYFVLGNHDYYHSEVEQIREMIKKLCQTVSNLHWLGDREAALLTPLSLVTGHDTWADGRYGNYFGSFVRVNDETYIQDFKKAHYLGRRSLLRKMQELADSDCNALFQQVTEGIARHRPKNMFILLHVPPFSQVCLYNNEESCDNYLPFFASKASGDLLLKLSHTHRDVDFTILCGHTHHKAFYQPLPNLAVHVETAEYLKSSVAGQMVHLEL